MELGAKNYIEDGLLGPNPIMVVYVDPLGYKAEIAGLSEDFARTHRQRAVPSLGVVSSEFFPQSVHVPKLLVLTVTLFQTSNIGIP